MIRFYSYYIRSSRLLILIAYFVIVYRSTVNSMRKKKKKRAMPSRENACESVPIFEKSVD